ncbi:MAG: ribonuclease P protein component, partial [Spirochaetota bacterium]|nr:ribonuclease P protein component [Spirochaetota bacterium]
GQLFKKGIRVRVRDYLGIFLNNGKTHAKFGVSFKRKIGNAVTRNYEKRTLIEIYRQSKSFLPKVSLLVIKLSKDKLTFSEKKRQMTKLFSDIRRKVL